MQSPTAFDMVIANINQTVRLLITASPLSPRIPVNVHPGRIEQWLPLLPSTSSHVAKGSVEWATNAHLVFEPLILGAVPRTTIRTVGLLLAFGIGAGLAVPLILRVLQAALDATIPATTEAEACKKHQ
jgi:hypothetical protein